MSRANACPGKLCHLTSWLKMHTIKTCNNQFFKSCSHEIISGTMKQVGGPQFLCSPSLANNRQSGQPAIRSNSKNRTAKNYMVFGHRFHCEITASPTQKQLTATSEPASRLHMHERVGSNKACRSYPVSGECEKVRWTC